MTDQIGGGGGGGAFEDTDGDGVAELQDSHTDHQGGDARNIAAMDALRGKFTNETLVALSTGSGQSISMNTWTTVAFDNEDQDVRNEWDAVNHQLTVDETGLYYISFIVGFSVGADGDDVRVRMRDTTNATDRMVVHQTAGDLSKTAVTGHNIANLTAGDVYELQAVNVDSSDSLLQTSSLSVRRVMA